MNHQALLDLQKLYHVTSSLELDPFVTSVLAQVTTYQDRVRTRTQGALAIAVCMHPHLSTEQALRICKFDESLIEFVAANANVALASLGDPEAFASLHSCAQLAKHLMGDVPPGEESPETYQADKLLNDLPALLGGDLTKAELRIVSLLQLARNNASLEETTACYNLLKPYVPILGRAVLRTAELNMFMHYASGASDMQAHLRELFKKEGLNPWNDEFFAQCLIVRLREESAPRCPVDGVPGPCIKPHTRAELLSVVLEKVTTYFVVDHEAQSPWKHLPALYRVAIQETGFPAMLKAVRGKKNVPLAIAAALLGQAVLNDQERRKANRATSVPRRKRKAASRKPSEKGARKGAGEKQPKAS